MQFVENAPDAVLATAKEMLDKGLVEGTAGNISARMEDGNVCITPSSVDYTEMTIDDLVVIAPDGSPISGERAASSEKLLHLACYQAFDDVGSVIHSHPVHATMFAIARRSVPACIDEFSMYVGGEVRVTDYAISGSAEVGQAAVKALEGRGAALLANHGMVAVGPNPAKALHITALVERVAHIVSGAIALGQVHDLPDEVNRSFADVYSLMRMGI
ncbi:MAG: L-fuculose-phosphate aldolase [Actinomycetota bacterium]|jgi:L-fuculose-phosphate aldolase|nr:L-fuculose-phosphate aldolase [Actinomycetota bacterium]